jgi:amphi-Trp domain-containing protein
MDKKDTGRPPARRDGKFDHESAQDAQDLAEYLEALAQGFIQGKMRFSNKGTRLELHPKGLITFAVEAKAIRGRMKLNLRFTWREDTPESESEHSPLVIDSGGGSAV